MSNLNLPYGEYDAQKAEDALAIAQDHAEELIEAARLFDERLETQSPVRHGGGLAAAVRELIEDHLHPLKMLARELREEEPLPDPNREHRLSGAQLGVPVQPGSPIFDTLLFNMSRNFGA